VPDDFDYAWLRWLIAHPSEWTSEDLAAVRFLIEEQRRALGELHAKDADGRRSAQVLLDQLELALRSHLAQDLRTSSN
jgi:hypothetical protein